MQNIAKWNEMIRAMADVDVKQGLRLVRQQIEAACSRRSAEFQDVQPRLVAVSKIKPTELIIQAYEEGKRTINLFVF